MNVADTLLDRNTYRKIKGYSKDEMADFCNRVYMQGKNAAFDNLDLEQLRSDIGAVKGIGEVKLAEIMGIIENALFNEADTKGEE